MIEAPEQLISLKEACELLRLSRATIDRLIRAGDLPVVVIGGRRLVRFLDVRTFVEERTVCGCGSARAEVGA